MKFTELPEELRPENFQFPARTMVGAEEFETELDNGGAIHNATGAQMMFIFADARHIEFADAYTGHLLFPPEMMMVPMFKSMAKSKGPFVVGVQYGFVTPARQRHVFDCSPVRTDVYRQRFFSIFDLVWSDMSEYDFRFALRLKLARKLGLRRYSVEVGINSTLVGRTSFARNSRVLIRRTEHIYHIPNEENEQ